MTFAGDQRPVTDIRDDIAFTYPGATLHLSDKTGIHRRAMCIPLTDRAQLPQKVTTVDNEAMLDPGTHENNAIEAMRQDPGQASTHALLAIASAVNRLARAVEAHSTKET
jgi:hypothetical protein